MKISIKNLFVRYKLGISTTFILLTIESVLIALIPFGIGVSIDNLVEGSLNGIYVLLAILLAITLFSTIRRLYDTRVYSKVYALISSSLVKNHKKDKIENSKIVARTTLVKELVDFFEFDLTDAYRSIVGICSAFFMIVYINFYIATLCLATIVVVGIIYYFSKKKIFNENSNLNKEIENRLNIIEGKSKLTIVPHFRKISQSMIKLSDIEVYNYIIIQLLIGSLLIASIFIANANELSTGEIFSIITYVFNFALDTLTLPLIFGQFIRLQEITNRINKAT